MEILHITDPMYVPEEDPIAQCLLEAYRSYTKDMSKPLVIGGGTYVKELDGFLAFGPEFAHTPKDIQQQAAAAANVLTRLLPARGPVLVVKKNLNGFYLLIL